MAAPIELAVRITARASVPPRDAEPTRTIAIASETTTALAIGVGLVIDDIRRRFGSGDSLTMDLAVSELADICNSLERISRKLVATADRSRGR